ncbi:MAG: universal stress protein [Pirellulaceae bacterium]|nr:universal stress protein [Planctomycetales bacterium]
MSGLSKEKVVVPIDFSDESLRAIDVALEIATAPQGVHVVHVLPELMVAEPAVVWETLDDDTRCHNALNYMQEKLGDAKLGGKYEQVQKHAFVGDAGKWIAEFAEDLSADLIVMPSHGRTGIKRLMIGSVAERVVRLAHCPVLVLRS